MDIKTQKTAELTQLGKLVEDMRVCMLTSIDGDAAETVMVARPMSPQEMCEQGAFWFLTDSNSTKLQHLQLMNLAFSDEAEGIYVSISGHGEIITDCARLESSWTPFARPWFPDGVDSTNLALLKFVPHIAEYWDAPNGQMVRLFAMAISVAATKPIGLGEHGYLNASSSRT